MKPLNQYGRVGIGFALAALLGLGGVFLALGASAQQQSDTGVHNPHGASGTMTPVYVISISQPPSKTPTPVFTPAAGTNTWTPTRTASSTPTATATGTPTTLPMFYGTLPQASITPVVQTTPVPGFYTGLELRSGSNFGAVPDYFKVTASNAVIFGPYIAPIGQIINLPQIMWDNGKDNLGFIPPSAATTFTYSYRLLYWPVGTTPPTLGLPTQRSYGQ